MLEIDTASEEAFSSVSAYPWDSGTTFTLEASTTAGRSWRTFILERNPDQIRIVRKTPNAKLRLRFLSGDQTDLNEILR